MILREREIDIRAMTDVCRYVSMNVYVNGIRLGYIIPELTQYMSDNYDAHADNILSMFGLDELPMLQDTLPEIPMNFDLTIHPEEIQAIMQIRLDQYAEATAMLEAYKQIFINDVTQSWEDYMTRTLDTVAMEMDVHRDVVGDTIDYLWDRSAFPGASLDEVYPRPTVAFAARNKSVQPQTGLTFDARDAYIGAIAVVGFISLLAIFKHKEKSAKVLF